jgi:Tol biopolymer transport system component
MGGLTRWLASLFKSRPITTRHELAVEPLEARSVPAALISVGVGATAADGDASDELLGISGDGNFVLFASKASNLVPGATDNNNDFDLFWRDLKAGVTKLVTAQAGTLNALGFGAGSTNIPLSQRAVLSNDGQRVAYVSGAPAAAVTGDPTVQDQLATNDVFWWRADTGEAKLVSIRFGENAAVGNSFGIEAIDPAISNDGKVVAYGTTLNGALIDVSATLDNGNATYDIFIRDMEAADPTKATTAVTRIPGKADLVGKYGSVDRPVGSYMTGDGRFVTYSTVVGADIITGVADLPGTPDVFVRDMTIGTEGGVALVSVATNGAAVGNLPDQFAHAPIISRGGPTVVFVAKTSGGAADKQLVADYVPNGAPTELYVRTNPFGVGGATRLVTAVTGTPNFGANGFVEQPIAGTPASYRVTADGKFVAFVSSATNLVDASKDQNGIGLDVFVRDVLLGKTDVVSVGKDGLTGTAPSDRPSISDDGRYVTFISASPELGLLVTDTNGTSDAFLRDRTEGVTRAISTTPNALTTGDGATTNARIAVGGTSVVFVSRAKNLTDSPPLTKAIVNVYQSAIPLPTPFAQGALAVSGLPDGQVVTYIFDAAGKLVPIGKPFVPFPGTNTPARIAVADVNGDGSADVISVVGPGGGSLVRITDGATGKDLIAPMATYEPSFIGGLFVAAADLDGDGKAEIILSPDVGGGARIQIYSFNGTTLIQRANFFGIADPDFRGGARVAAGDIDGDGTPEVVVGAGFGGGPRVAVYAGSKLFSVLPGESPPKLFGDFFAFPGEDSTRLRNGVFVAVGDINGDGQADLVFGGGPGGGPRVYILDGSLLTGGELDIAYGKPLANFFAFDSNLRGGVRVAVKNIDGDSKADLVVGSGEKSASQVRTYLGKFLSPAADPSAFEVIDPFGSPSVPGGVFVG